MKRRESSTDNRVFGIFVLLVFAAILVIILLIQMPVAAHFVFVLALVTFFLLLISVALLTKMMNHSVPLLLWSMLGKNKSDDTRSPITIEEKFRLIADYSYDWEYWEKPDKMFAYVSPSCETITGYSPNEFYGDAKLLQKIIFPEDLEKWLAYQTSILNDADAEAFEFRIITKTGETRWVDHVARIVRDAQGKPLGIRGSNRDITKLKLLKKEVKMLQGLLPICASCKNIRDDKGYWTQIELYIATRTHAEFSHSICPECARRLYPDLDLEAEE